MKRRFKQINRVLNGRLTDFDWQDQSCPHHVRTIGTDYHSTRSLAEVSRLMLTLTRSLRSTVPFVQVMYILRLRSTVLRCGSFGWPPSYMHVPTTVASSVSPSNRLFPPPSCIDSLPFLCHLHLWSHYREYLATLLDVHHRRGGSCTYDDLRFHLEAMSHVYSW